MKLARLKPRIANIATGTSALAIDRNLRRVYDSRLWRDHVRPAKLAVDPLCQRCKYMEQSIPGVHVDHRQPLRQGGAPFAWSNLVTLCTSCHSHKTTCEQRGAPYPEVAASAPQPIGYGDATQHAARATC